MASLPSWVILERVPRFHDGGIAVDVKSSSGSSTSLLIPRHGVDTSIPRGKPYIIATDKSGAVLVAFSEHGRYPTLSVLTVAKGELPASIRTLPPRKPPVHPIARLSSIGMTPVPAPSSGGTAGAFLVAELQPISGTGGARLISFNTQGGEWREKELVIPETHSHRAWGRHGVLSHAGKLWWTDLSWGLICCNPLDIAPTPAFVELPGSSALSFADHPAIEGRRGVWVSDSRIRYVEMTRIGDGPSRILLWTLHTDRTGTGWVWMKNTETNFADIWARESYARTRLPAALPELILLSPMDPSLACFRLESYLLGLNIGTKRVQWVQFEPLDHGELIAWELPCCILSSGRALGAVRGFIDVAGFQSKITYCSETSTVLLINKMAYPYSVFHIKLWHRNYRIGRLSLVQQFNGSRSVAYSSADTDFLLPVIVRNVKQFILYVPIPDVYKIFTEFGIQVGRSVDLDGTGEGCQPSGPSRIVGSFMQGSRMVTFKAFEQDCLMLECSLGDMECFRVQLLNYPVFYSLIMTANPDKTTTVALRATSETPERTICTESIVFTYAPLPYLAKIARLF